MTTKTQILSACCKAEITLKCFLCNPPIYMNLCSNCGKDSTLSYTQSMLDEAVEAQIRKDAEIMEEYIEGYGHVVVTWKDAARLLSEKILSQLNSKS